MRTPGSLGRATPERRRALLEAATTLFAAQGLPGTTMDDVAQKAGVSRGAVYHHFASREELFAAAFDDAMEHIQAALLRAIEGLGTDYGVREGVERLVLAYLAWHEAEPARGLVVRKGRADERLHAQLGVTLQAQQRFQAGVLARFSKYRDDGEIVQAPDVLLVALIIGPVRDFVGSWYSMQDASVAKAAMRAARRTLPGAAWASIDPSGIKKSKDELELSRTRRPPFHRARSLR